MWWVRQNSNWKKKGKKSYRTYFCILAMFVAGCCYSKLMKDGHRCIERAMHHSCPVCFEVRKSRTIFCLCLLVEHYSIRYVRILQCSFYLTQQKTSVSYLVAIPYIWNVQRRWNHISSKYITFEMHITLGYYVGNSIEVCIWHSKISWKWNHCWTFMSLLARFIWNEAGARSRSLNIFVYDCIKDDS